MIEIISVRELRYSSPEEVPIEKEEVIKSTEKYCKTMTMYDEIRKKLMEKAKSVYGEKNRQHMIIVVISLYDRNFLNKLISVWKRKAFEKLASIPEEKMNPEKERKIIDECFNNDSIKTELMEYFLSDFWKTTSLTGMDR